MSPAPKYDFKIPRKGGFMWASETNLESLQYWFDKFSVSSNPQYEAKDQDRAKKLSYWVKFREADPYSRWKGTRGNAEVVAAQPTDRPAIVPWDAPSEPARGDAYEDPGAPDDNLNF